MASYKIRKYRVKIASKFLLNTRSDSNFNRKYDYDYGMQGLSKKQYIFTIFAFSNFP